MKQHILNSIIGNLEDDPIYAVKIDDLDKEKTICNNLRARDMEADSGSVKDWFNTHIFEAGVKNFGITVRRKNGSGFKTMGDMQIFTLANGKVQDTSAPAQPAAAPIDQGQPFGGLNGVVQGLNAVDTAFRFMDHPRLIERNNRLESENEMLKEKVAELKEKLLESKFTDAKAAGNSQLVQTLLGVLPEAVAALKSGGGAQAPGLNAAAGEGLSPIKQQIMQLVSGNSDATCSWILAVVSGFGNADFVTELTDLLNKYELIKQQ